MTRILYFLIILSFVTSGHAAMTLTANGFNNTSTNFGTSTIIRRSYSPNMTAAATVGYFGNLPAGGSDVWGPSVVAATNTVWLQAETTQGHKSNIQQANATYTGAPAISVNFYWGGIGAATNCIGKISVRNDTSTIKGFFLLRDGQQTGIEATVLSGQTHVFEFSVPDCDWSHIYTVKSLIAHDGLFGDGQGGVYADNPLFGDNVGGPLSQGTNNVSPSDPSPGIYGGATGNGLTPFTSTYSNTLDNTGNPIGPITFTSTNQSQARDSTLQTGFNAVRDGLSGGLGEVVNELNELQQINRDGFSSLSGLTNGSGLSDSNAINSLHYSITNNDGRVQQAYDQIVSDINDRNAKAQSALGGSFGSGDSWSASAGTVTDGSGNGGGAQWSVNLGGYAWDFSPFRDGMADVYSGAKALIAWLLLAFYLRLVIGDCVSALNEFTKTRGVGLPLMNAEAFGFGFNMGLTLWPVLVGALMLSWAAFIAFCLTLGFGFFGDYLGIWQAGPWQLTDTRAMQLVNAFFPTSLLVGLAASYAVFRFTLVKAMVMAQAAVKWIMSV